MFLAIHERPNMDHRPPAGFDCYAAFRDEIYSADGQVPVLEVVLGAIALEVFGAGKESIVIGSANGVAVAMEVSANKLGYLADLSAFSSAARAVDHPRQSDK
jgi:hypothetical protein